MQELRIALEDMGLEVVRKDYSVGPGFQIKSYVRRIKFNELIDYVRENNHYLIYEDVGNDEPELVVILNR